MSDRFTFDANVLIYAVDHAYPDKQKIAFEIVSQARRGRWPVTLQTIGEFFHVVTRKRIMSFLDAVQAVESLIDAFDILRSDVSGVRTAMQARMAGHLSYWDALMLATSIGAGCTVCFSEDMGEGARLGGIEVVNPFGPNGLTERAARLLSPTP